MVINTNIMSLNAQRNLNKTNNMLATSMQRLSTGLRINSAKDDAAGLAISERMTSQIRGLNQAIRNANDGISFAQTGEGALSTMGDAIQRIRELAVQAVNDTNTASDRQALNDEVQQLIAEVNRVANTTQFNGQNILDGSMSSLTFQVGANQNQTITVTGMDARGSKLGADLATGTSVDSATMKASGGAFTINGTTIDTSAVVASGDVDDLIDAINQVANDSGVSATKASTLSVSFAHADVDDTLTINGVDISYTAATDDIDTLTTAINDVSAQTGVTATNDGTNITLTSANAADMVINTTSTLLGGAAISNNTYQAGVVLSTDVGDGTADASIILAGADAGDFGLSEAASTASRTILNDVNVLTASDATSALQALDYALQKVNGMRATLGATQTRFESTIANLSISAENLSAARSRIQDADFAAETAAMTRAQILQQAGVAMVSQANAAPQVVLSLLK